MGAPWAPSSADPWARAPKQKAVVSRARAPNQMANTRPRRTNRWATTSPLPSPKNGLFEFYAKIVAEAIRFIENDLFEFYRKNIAEEGVLQDRNRDTFHRKTASSSSMQKSLQKRCVSSKTTSSSSIEKILQRKEFFRIEIATRFIENSLFDQGRIPTLLWNFIFSSQKYNNVSTMIQ